MERHSDTEQDVFEAEGLRQHELRLFWSETVYRISNMAEVVSQTVSRTR